MAKISKEMPDAVIMRHLSLAYRDGKYVDMCPLSVIDFLTGNRYVTCINGEYQCTPKGKRSALIRRAADRRHKRRAAAARLMMASQRPGRDIPRLVD